MPQMVTVVAGQLHIRTANAEQFTVDEFVHQALASVIAEKAGVDEGVVNLDKALPADSGEAHFVESADESVIVDYALEVDQGRRQSTADALSGLDVTELSAMLAQRLVQVGHSPQLPYVFNATVEDAPDAGVEPIEVDLLSAMRSKLLEGSPPAPAAVGAEASSNDSFCCMMGSDTANVCGSCLPAATAREGSECGADRASCSACGATWCRAGEGLPVAPKDAPKRGLLTSAQDFVDGHYADSLVLPALIGAVGGAGLAGVAALVSWRCQGSQTGQAGSLSLSSLASDWLSRAKTAMAAPQAQSAERLPQDSPRGKPEQEQAHALPSTAKKSLLYVDA